MGGLRDTVVPWDGAAGTGLRFETFTAAAAFDAVKDALAVVADGPAYERLQQNAFAADHGWERSAGAYVALYRRVVPAVAA